MIKSILLCVALMMAGAVVPAYGQVRGPEMQNPHAQPPAEGPKPHAEAAPAPASSEKPVVTHHEIKLPGGVLHYTATAGYMPLKDESGKLLANFFFVAYTKEEPGKAPASNRAGQRERSGQPTQPSGASDGAARARKVHAGNPFARPIMFVFNGGPGAASVWLHLGCAGPRRVDLADDGLPLPPPAKLVDNDSTWLDATDLVFIDPVGTGYSRAATPDENKNFYNFKEDIQSVGEFIRVYLTQYERVGFAEISGRRIVWHDPRRDACGLSAGPLRYHA